MVGLVVIFHVDALGDTHHHAGWELDVSCGGDKEKVANQSRPVIICAFMLTGILNVLLSHIL